MSAKRKPSPSSTRDTGPKTEHVDVLIVGAGMSGIGAAYHLRKQRPDDHFVVLEREESYGGTWWTHRYPGIRSDSDLHTFGYSFKAWRGPPIATAAEIRSYMGEVISENRLEQHIRYKHTITSASWSSDDNLWTIEATRTDTGETLRYTAKFLWMCQGYYRHNQGYMPKWPGMTSFKGQIVHSEEWPDDLDTTGKQVLVIGSGATAATIIPAIAPQAAHVTMLQRSPTFFITARNVNDLAQTLRQLQVDENWIHEIVRRKVLFDQAAFTRRCFEEPDTVKTELIGAVQTVLGPDYDTAKHFTPSYRPWRQRVAFVPDADLFKAIASGKASVVTDEIETFTKTGVRLKSGAEIKADIIVGATGFNLSALGDIPFMIDGRPLTFADTVTYRGMMFTGIPNMVWIFGYIRASWTLRVDLVADFVCRLLEKLEASGTPRVEVAIPVADTGMERLPWIDDQNFNPGYFARGLDILPRRGAKPEWQHSQDYWADKDIFPSIDLDAPAFVYGGTVKTTARHT